MNFTKILTKLLSDVVDKFKVKSPEVFLIIIGVLFGVQWAIGSIMEQAGFEDVIIGLFGIEIEVLASARNLIIALLAATGAHTPDGQLKVSVAEPLPEWVVGKTYAKGDKVKQEGKSYIALKEHASLNLNQPKADVITGEGHWEKL